MLQLPTHRQPLTIVGIDPGTSCLGLSHLTWQMDTHQIHVHNAHTLTFSNTHADYQVLAEIHGNRMSRYHQLRDQFGCYLRDVQPHVIVCESPFLGKFAATFQALSECMLILQQCIIDYDVQMPWVTVPPITVKQAIGIDLSNKKGREKEDNRDALRRMANLTWDIDLEQLDEHSVDAVGVALYYPLTESTL